ncbi:MAG: chemotaxis protein CheW [Gemmatimonadaceae bacterium]
MTESVAHRQSEIDWPAVLARVNAAGASTQAAEDHETQFATRILGARARRLAQPLVLTQDANADGAIVARLGDSAIAFPLEHVVEILRPRGLTALPGSQPPATLVIGWRGRILTVLDLNSVRPAGRRTITDTTRVIVLGERRGMLGVLVDDVDTVRSLQIDQVHPASRDTFGGATWIRGMTEDAVAVADVPSLLAQYDA